MNIFFKICLLALVSVITVSCEDKNNALEKTPEGTIAIGKFRVTGNAQSGPYALKLFKIDRFIADEFAQISAWRIVESERKNELLTERGEINNTPTRTDQFIDNGITALESKLFGEVDKVDTPVTKEYLNGYPAADYILVGQMDGFDFDIDRQTHLVKTQSGQEVAATLNSRAYIAQSTISLRLINVENREVVVAKRIFFRDKITSSANMESHVNEVLKRMASRLVAETLLSLAGDIQVAGINEDGTLLLNRGSQSGLKKDMVMNLKRQGEWVKDPVTGDNLSKSSHEIGTIVILSVTDKTAVVKYSGADRPNVEDLAVFDNTEFNKQDKGFQPVRMAVGTVKFSDTSPKAPDAKYLDSLSEEIEQGLAQQLNGKLGIKIVDQESQRIRDMLAQQMLSDLNQGREPGLPLGTLRGVDYLVFMSIVRSELTLPKKETVFLEVLDQSVDQIKSGKGYIKAYVFLQDVNTAETAARTEIKIHKQFKKELTAEKAWSELVEVLLSKVNRSILTQLRPLQVLSNANNSILLNHGKEVLKIGDVLTVFGKGETIVDPYTGQRINSVGSVQVAELNVTQFQPGGYALAELTSGTLPEVGMSVSINKKKACEETTECESDDHSEQSSTKKQKVHQYNW